MFPSFPNALEKPSRGGGGNIVELGQKNFREILIELASREQENFVISYYFHGEEEIKNSRKDEEEYFCRTLHVRSIFHNKLLPTHHTSIYWGDSPSTHFP